ncbi:Heat shock transcription factor [Sporothrix curviconia]|uniref:Heat shock transcription factor n=1 Tax=Sporothrix curviconia TaxID=1260050 RepID=A0ABP0CMC1_9PEZI
MSNNPRKRPAPGTTPILPVTANVQPGFDPAAQQDQLLQWAGGLPDGTTFNDLSRNANAYMMGQSGQYIQQQLRQQQQHQHPPQVPLQSAQPQQLHIQPQPVGQQQQQQQQQKQQQQSGQVQPQTSTAIARRPPNRALIPSVPRPTFDPSADLWANFGDDAALLSANPNHNPTNNNADGSNNSGGTGLPGENESIEVLEERAQRIKKDAQAKRKQIPPFVQKLSSFLEEAKNTELIRWSENGDSFIVLDEDEFAKTLIPELFKHNNYASFVRQLNMYGFHKRVGLSDNSMKASERKNKSPSEYYNPYFRRGHPNLLWLINKPKSGSKAKRGKKDDGDGDSDEDAGVEDPLLASHAGLQGLGNQHGRGYGPPGAGLGLGLGGGGGGGVIAGGSGVGHGVGGGALDASGHASGELAPLQKKDFQIIKDELSTLQSRQTQISKAMQRLQYDNAQLQQQARLFQNMHERHENSINAILNFLANVFRKSLEDQGSVQGVSVTDLLASILPNGQIPQGSVVDLSDDFDPRRPAQAPANLATPVKRQQRLLPPIPAASSTTASTAASTPVPQSGGAARGSSARSSSVLSPGQQHIVPGASSSGGGGGYIHQNLQPAHQPAMGSVTELFDSPSDSTYLQHELQSNPQEGMMRIINDTNANTPASGNAIDLLEAAANTPANMSTDQRNRVLNLMSTQGNMVQQPQHVAQHPPPPPQQTQPVNLARNTPMTGPGSSVSMSPQVPMTIPATNASPLTMPAMPAGASASLSPIIGNMQAVPPPSLQDISNTQAEIEALQRLQDEQNAKISDLSQLLGPLSPSGRVPGIEDDAVSMAGTNAGMQSPGYFDLGQYLDTNAFGDDFNFATDDLSAAGAGPGASSTAAAGGVPNVGDGNDFNFTIDPHNGVGNGNSNMKPDEGIDEGSLFAGTPSPAPTEEIQRTDLSVGNSPDPNAKRRRVS